jgi:hypothetical protein
MPAKGGFSVRSRAITRSLIALVGSAVIASLTAVVAPAQPSKSATGALVSVGSPTDLHPRNAQNEPALAVDASRPDVLAAGSNDLVDMQPCSELAATTASACSFPLGTFNLGVGLAGVYFSFDRGKTWTQPTYTGLTAAGCDPTQEPCIPEVGPIHTVPNYYEAGLRSRSDPGVAFGPAPGDGGFSWDNGSRLYYANLATNLTDTKIGGGINTSTGIAVSRIDDVDADRVQDQSNWSEPVLVTARSSSTAGFDKEQIWADNTASSPFFGNAYVCFVDFHSFSGGVGFPLFPYVATSTDGGVSWATRKVGPPVANSQRGSRTGCTIRTDSQGVVYAFYAHFASGTPGTGSHTMIKSFDGGKHWTQPQEVLSMNDACYFVDPISFRCTADGIAGARIDLAAAPSIDIANGAPTGVGATDEILDAWSDGRFGFNNEKSLLSYSTDGGQTWSDPAIVSRPADRSIYSAASISPDGATAYLVYMGLGADFQETTAHPRPLHGVFRTAAIGSDGAPGAWTTVFNGPKGDTRGTSQGRILYNEFLGDYVYAIATETYGAGVWTDVQATVDCPAMDAWRQESFDAGQRVFPAPWPLGDCEPDFGNNDIFSATTG